MQGKLQFFLPYSSMFIIFLLKPEKSLSVLSKSIEFPQISVLYPLSVYIARKSLTRLWLLMSLYRCNPHRKYRAWLLHFAMAQRKQSHVGQQKIPCVLLLSLQLKARSCVRGRHLYSMKTR